MTDFRRGDIIVYDSRAEYEPRCREIGLVVKKDLASFTRQWIYLIYLYEDGYYKDSLQVEESTVTQMQFHIVGNIWPIEEDPSCLIQYPPGRASNDGNTESVPI